MIKQKVFSQRNRFKLAQMLELQGVGVIPWEVQEGDKFNDEKWCCPAKCIGRSDMAEGVNLLVISQDSLTDCIKNGIELIRDHNYIDIVFKVIAKQSPRVDGHCALPLSKSNTNQLLINTLI